MYLCSLENKTFIFTCDLGQKADLSLQRQKAGVLESERDWPGCLGQNQETELGGTLDLVPAIVFELISDDLITLG